MLIQIIGWISAILSVLMFLPQTIKIVRMKETESLSGKTFLIQMFGTLGWVVYTSFTGYVYPFFANFIISILLLPILYYLFKKKKSFFYSIFVVYVIALILSLLNLFYFKAEANKMNIAFVIVAGSATGLAFFPQSYKIIKKRDTLNISVISTFLIILCNLMWTAYWIIKIIESTNDIDLWLSLLFTFMTIPPQIIIIYIIYSNKNT